MKTVVDTFETSTSLPVDSKKERRRKRAVERGYVQPKPLGFKHILVREDLAKRTQKQHDALLLHDAFNKINSAPSHYLADAIGQATGLVCKDDIKLARQVNKRATAARHQWDETPSMRAFSLADCVPPPTDLFSLHVQAFNLLFGMLDSDEEVIYASNDDKDEFEDELAGTSVFIYGGHSDMGDESPDAASSSYFFDREYGLHNVSQSSGPSHDGEFMDYDRLNHCATLGSPALCGLSMGAANDLHGDSRGLSMEFEEFDDEFTERLHDKKWIDSFSSEGSDDGDASFSEVPASQMHDNGKGQRWVDAVDSSVEDTMHEHVHVAGDEKITENTKVNDNGPPDLVLSQEACASLPSCEDSHTARLGSCADKKVRMIKHLDLEALLCAPWRRRSRITTERYDLAASDSSDDHRYMTPPGTFSFETRPGFGMRNLLVHDGSLHGLHGNKDLVQEDDGTWHEALAEESAGVEKDLHVQFDNFARSPEPLDAPVGVNFHECSEAPLVPFFIPCEVVTASINTTISQLTTRTVLDGIYARRAKHELDEAHAADRRLFYSQRAHSQQMLGHLQKMAAYCQRHEEKIAALMKEVNYRNQVCDDWGEYCTHLRRENEELLKRQRDTLVFRAGRLQAANDELQHKINNLQMLNAKLIADIRHDKDEALENIFKPEHDAQKPAPPQLAENSGNSGKTRRRSRRGRNNTGRDRKAAVLRQLVRNGSRSPDGSAGPMGSVQELEVKSEPTCSTPGCAEDPSCAPLLVDSGRERATPGCAEDPSSVPLLGDPGLSGDPGPLNLFKPCTSAGHSAAFISAAQQPSSGSICAPSQNLDDVGDSIFSCEQLVDLQYCYQRIAFGFASSYATTDMNR